MDNSEFVGSKSVKTYPQVTFPLISPNAITPTLPYLELEGLNSTLTPLRGLSEPTCLLGSIEY